jgi:hypothetical protein
MEDEIEEKRELNDNLTQEIHYILEKQENLPVPPCFTY